MKSFAHATLYPLIDLLETIINVIRVVVLDSIATDVLVYFRASAGYCDESGLRDGSNHFFPTPSTKRPCTCKATRCQLQPLDILSTND